MSNKIIQLDEDLIQAHLKDLVRSSVEETLNALLIGKPNESSITEKYYVLSDSPGISFQPFSTESPYSCRRSGAENFQNSRAFLTRRPLLKDIAAENLSVEELLIDVSGRCFCTPR